MDVAFYVRSMQFKLLSTFNVTRAEVEQQLAEFNIRHPNVPSKRHFKYLHQSMVQIRPLIALYDFFDNYMQSNRKSNVAIVVVAKKIDQIHSQIQECRQRYKNTCKILNEIIDTSFVYSVVMMALIWQKFWMYNAAKYDLLMRSLYIIYRQPTSFRSERLFAQCLAGDDVHDNLEEYGYMILVEQNRNIDIVSNNVLIGRNYMRTNDDVLQRDIVDYLATSTVLDPFIGSAEIRTRPRMNYTKNLGTSVTVNAEASPQQGKDATKKKDPDLNYESIIEDIITENSLAYETRSIFQEYNIFFNQLLSGYLKAYEGYGATYRSLQEAPLKGDLIDIHQRRRRDRTTSTTSTTSSETPYSYSLKNYKIINDITQMKKSQW